MPSDHMIATEPMVLGIPLDIQVLWMTSLFPEWIVLANPDFTVVPASKGIWIITVYNLSVCLESTFIFRSHLGLYSNCRGWAIVQLWPWWLPFCQYVPFICLPTSCQTSSYISSRKPSPLAQPPKDVLLKNINTRGTLVPVCLGGSVC